MKLPSSASTPPFSSSFQRAHAVTRARGDLRGAPQALRPLILDPALLESKLANATVCHTLQAAVFITGEHAVHVRNRCAPAALVRLLERQPEPSP